MILSNYFIFYTMKTIQKTAFFFIIVALFSGCQDSPKKGSPQDNIPVKEVSEEDKVPSDNKIDTTSEEVQDPLLALLSKKSETEEITEYTLVDVALHNTPDDCWIVVDGDVANITSFFGSHPGGDEALEQSCGKDATEGFKSVKKHDPAGYKKLKTLKVGTLQQ